MVKYYGHPSRAAWNVSLWINNNEGLYNLARESIRRTKTRRQAAEYMLTELKDCGIERTPDGYKYTVSNIMNAMVGYGRR